MPLTGEFIGIRHVPMKGRIYLLFLAVYTLLARCGNTSRSLLCGAKPPA
jgi:hypothetical protein